MTSGGAPWPCQYCGPDDLGPSGPTGPTGPTGPGGPGGPGSPFRPGASRAAAAASAASFASRAAAVAARICGGVYSPDSATSTDNIASPDSGTTIRHVAPWYPRSRSRTTAGPGSTSSNTATPSTTGATSSAGTIIAVRSSDGRDVVEAIAAESPTGVPWMERKSQMILVIPVIIARNGDRKKRGTPPPQVDDGEAEGNLRNDVARALRRSRASAASAPRPRRSPRAGRSSHARDAGAPSPSG